MEQIQHLLCSGSLWASDSLEQTPGFHLFYPSGEPSPAADSSCHFSGLGAWQHLLQLTTASLGQPLFSASRTPHSPGFPPTSLGISQSPSQALLPSDFSCQSASRHSPALFHPPSSLLEDFAQSRGFKYYPHESLSWTDSLIQPLPWNSTHMSRFLNQLPTPFSTHLLNAVIAHAYPDVAAVITSPISGSPFGYTVEAPGDFEKVSVPGFQPLHILI